MGARLAIISGATLLAVAVLLATFLSDTPQVPSGRSTPIGDVNAPAVPNVTEQQLRRTPARPETGQPATGEYQIERLNRGKLWQFWGQRVTPLPQGLMQVEVPGMRMHMETWRVLQITADRGMFVAPDNQPRSGDFEGNVIVTLFESPDTKAPNMADDSPHIRLRLYLDQASFDVELGQIDSRSPVHLTGPVMDFVGQGLRINYNERRNRIERLEVATGQTLRIKPRLARQRVEREPAEPMVTLPPSRMKPNELAEAAPPTTREERQRARQERQRELQEAAAPPPPDGPQYYRATFEKNVHIASPSGIITADTMQVLFSFNEDEGQPQTGHSASIAPSFSRAARGPWTTHGVHVSHPPQAAGLNLPMTAHLLTWVLATPSTAALPQTKTPSLLAADDDDVIITWTGKLIVSPEESQPAALAGPDDRMVVFNGSPVRIVTPKGDTVTAAVVEYTEQSQRIAMVGSSEFPLVVHSVESGDLRGQSLEIDQAKGSGYIIGPGSLATAQDGGEVDGLTIAWADRLDMTFYAPSNKKEADAPSAGTPALRTADFQGAVKAKHPQFDLTAQRLAARLTPPTPVGDDTHQALQRLDAAGNVHVDAKGNTPDDALALDAQQLTIDLAAAADGRTTPSGMKAQDRVKIVRPQQTLWANKVEVGLTPGEDGKVAVQTLRAEEDVRLDMKQAEDISGGGIAALAHVLVADAVKGEAELFGNATTMAQLMREDGELAGQRIVLFEKSKQAHVPGPGSLTFVANRTGQGENSGGEPTHLNVTWSQAMRFDDTAGVAAFVGDVVAATSSASDRTTLNANELHIDFEEATTAAQGDAMTGLLGGDRRIRKLTATADPRSDKAQAVFLAMSYSDAPPADAQAQPHMDTRFRLAGPSIVFTNPDERVTVAGKGSMLIEDYRGIKPEVRDQKSEASPPPAPGPAASVAAGDVPVPSSLNTPKPAEQKPSRDQSIALTGKGQTLFTWTGSLQLDANNNNMLIKDNVLMIHRSPQRASVVQLNCDSLAADQESSGGMSVWLEGDAPKPQMQSVKADGNVRIREATTTILANHAHYDGSTEYVDIFGEGKRLVTVQDDDEPLGQLTAKKLRWLLPTNRFEIITPGPGRAPMGIQRRVDEKKNRATDQRR